MNDYVGTVAWNVQDLLRQFLDIKAQNKNKLFQEPDIVMSRIIQNRRVSVSQVSRHEKKISFSNYIFFFCEKDSFFTPSVINTRMFILILLLNSNKNNVFIVFYPPTRDSA